MKLGVITDIHNNVTALRIIAAKLQQMRCDMIICCGDIIGIGPCPEETVRYMMQIPNLIAVRGNHETYLLEGMPAVYPNKENMFPSEMEHHRWEHRLLSPASIAFLRNLPYRMDIVCEGFRISVMHSCTDRDGRYSGSVKHPCESDLRKMFADVESDIILYGHDHSRNIFAGDKLYINVGSLGCPARDRNLARAGVLTIENGNAVIDPMDVVYDADAVIRLIDQIRYPDAENIKKIFYGV